MATILVPVDFSPCAPLLVDEAARFADAFGDELLLLHVSEPPRGVSPDSEVHPPGRAPGRVGDLLRADAEPRLAELAARSRRATQTRFVLGHVAAEILRVARDEHPRMVVMATHGRSGIPRVLLGSVAEEVLRHAAVPVVTVRTLHRPDCTAVDCATCAEGHTDLEKALEAEREG